MAKKKKAKKEKKPKKIEQSIWTVNINSQTLFKKAVDGRTILLGMTAKENEKVKEVMDKAIEELSKILKKRTTQHEVPPQKEQVTGIVDNTAPDDSDEEKKSTNKSEAAKKKEFKKNGEDGDDSIFDKLKS